jgi:hypothetical protein
MVARPGAPPGPAAQRRWPLPAGGAWLGRCPRATGWPAAGYGPATRPPGGLAAGAACRAATQLARGRLRGPE